MKTTIYLTLISLSLIALVVFGTAWVVMSLWNAALVPALLIVAPIGYWQAFGITFLSHILFKGYYWHKQFTA